MCYVRFPEIIVRDTKNTVSYGFEEIRWQIFKQIESVRGQQDEQKDSKVVVTVECYPGVNQEELLEGLLPLEADVVFHSDELAFPPEVIDEMLEPDMTDDPVFAVMTNHHLREFFYEEKIANVQKEIASFSSGVILIYGVGASLIHLGDVQVVCDITRWEIQLRYRKGMTNWRTAKKNAPKLQKYKRGYFAEWRLADEVKESLLSSMNFYLDMTTEGKPAMIEGEAYQKALKQTAKQPFRLVPYFDPGVWGGNWMKKQFELPENGSNYAWSFDGVPEENSLLLNFNGRLIQTPAMNLVLMQPHNLLGERVYQRFGKEFPIRFDMLDTMNGQNLSLQVHPMTKYIQEQFHMAYTQDESYYILDAKEDEACVYLGVKTGINPEDMIADLQSAQQGKMLFPAEQYVNQIPVKKHDHVLIPAGTLHCSGANTMVLEISATPYIFTFKMWDWGRLDLDGKPRPIHLERGKANIQWNRDTQWVEKNLVNRVQVIHEDTNCVVEKTGLHELEFIDTFRISTEKEALIQRNDSVHVINLVEGKQVQLVSPDNDFPPYELHYAETCIIPQGAGAYKIVSGEGEPVKVILACVRQE